LVGVSAESKSVTVVSWVREVFKPGSGDVVEPLTVQAVDPLASTKLDANQACLFEDSQMARGGRPSAVEATGNLTGGHCATTSVQHDQDRPS